MPIGDKCQPIRDNLDLWREAEKAVAAAQSYKIGSRALTRANLSEIVARIKYWEDALAKCEAGAPSGIRVMRFVPRDL